MHEVVITVPCYNESKRLDLDEFVAFAKSNPQVAFLFVNDGSTDSTGDTLKTLTDLDKSSFRAIHLVNNVGKAEAVRKGIGESLKSDPKYVGIWDADLATPLAEIPRLCEIMDSCPSVQMVFGSRVKLMGRIIERPALRHYLGRLSATLISWVLGLPIYDTQCGAKVFRVTDVLSGLFEEKFLSSWIFDVEIIARTMSANGGSLPENTIYELPLNEWRHKGGSKIKPVDYILALRELSVIRRKYF